MPPAELYHYCERRTCADIVRARVIRAKPQTLHKDMFGKDAGRVTPPIVWLTTSPTPDGVIMMKMRSAGWPMPPVGDLCRVVLPGDLPHATALDEFADGCGIEADWWAWVVHSGQIVDSHWEDWRLSSSDIPSSSWLRVEVFGGQPASGPIWTPWPI